MTGPIRVLIADDHREFLDGLQALLRTAAGQIEIAGIARDGNEAIVRSRELQPDVVLMDLHMPQVNGVAATREITSASPHIRVLVLTMSDDDESVVQALRAGARGYVLKGSGREEMLRTIAGVADGELILGPAVAASISRSLEPPAPRQASFPELSAREAEVLELISTGASNTDISQQLFLSPKTVRNHISSIFAKLGVPDRAHAIVLVQQRRAVPHPRQP